MTTPNDPAYENQPQHWNSTHAVTLNIAASEVSQVFSNVNGVSFGVDGTNITASHNGLTSQSNQNVTAANGGFAFQTLSFSDANGFSFVTGAGSAIIGSYTVPSTAGLLSAVNVSAGTTSNNLSAITFSNANGVSFGLNGSTITGSHNALTTAMASNRGTDFVQATAAFAGTSASGTIASGGISVSIGPYITTAALSNHSHGNPTLALTNLTGTTASASNGFTLSLSAGAAGGAVVSNAIQDVATATGSGTNTSRFAADDHVHRGIAGIVGVGTASTFYGSFHISAGNNVTISTGGNSTAGSLAIHVAAPGGAATFTNCFENFDIQDGTATSSGSLSQLNVQPFTLPVNLSFGQINFIGIATVPATSASNSHSARLTNSTQRYTFGSSYTIGNTNIVDWFIFSRGSGVFSTELETFASTRNSFATNYQATYNGGATLTNAAGGSVSGSQTISMTISYPFLTSYTSTSIAANSTYTGYSSGYTTWTSAANNNSTFTFSTSAARTLSIGSTYPATLGWSGAKRVNMNFATSLSAGEYWLGYLRHSSSSSSSSSANAFTGAAGTGNSYSATFNHTAYANTMQLTFAGKTATVANSLGSLGFVTTNNMGVEPGLGSFSGTWASNTTYLNNLGNPAGAIALTQILSNVSFFRSWFQMASNMPV